MSGGISIATVVFIVFLILKLTGIIAWSWLWVTAPLWIGVSLLAAILLAAGVIGGSVYGIVRLVRSRRG